MIDMGNNANVVISPHVRTDPVSVHTRQDGIYYAVGRPNWDVGTEHRTCTYMRTNARKGAFLKPNSRTAVSCA